MPKVIQYIEVHIVDGVNYVMDETDNVLYYYITGSPVLTSNWAMTIGAGVTAGMRFHVQYNASPTLGGNHIFIVGTQIDDDLASKDFEAFGFYDGTSWSIRFFPDWEESGFVQTADIADDAVTNDKLNTMTQGTVKVGGAGGTPTDLNAKTSGQILIGDGTDIKSLAVTGDISINGAGLTAVVADAVDNTKLANMVRGTVKVGGIANAPTDLVASASGNILVGDGTDIKSVAMTGDVTITAAGVATVNPAILPATPVWEVGSGTLSVQTVGTGCDASGDNSISSGENTTASGDLSSAEGNQTIASAMSAHAEGSLCLASGIASHAEGAETHATGIGSHSEGQYTIAAGNYSHTEGYYSGTNIDSSSAFASGKFTIPADAQEIHTILKLITTTNIADELQLSDGTDGLTIPTDCTANIDIRVVAVQYGGVSGTVGDSFMQNIKLCAKNIAGVSSVVTHNAATLANYSIVSGDILYELSSCDAAFGGTVIASVSSNKLHISVTGENNKEIKWLAYVSLVWIGYNNFSL